MYVLLLHYQVNHVYNLDCGRLINFQLIHWINTIFHRFKRNYRQSFEYLMIFIIGSVLRYTTQNYYKMKRNRDIFSAIIPMYIMSKIIGLAPFTLRNKQFRPYYGVVEFLQNAAVIGGLIYIAIVIDELNIRPGVDDLALKCELYLGNFIFSSIEITKIEYCLLRKNAFILII